MTVKFYLFLWLKLWNFNVFEKWTQSCLVHLPLAVTGWDLTWWSLHECDRRSFDDRWDGFVRSLIYMEFWNTSRYFILHVLKVCELGVLLWANAVSSTVLFDVCCFLFCNLLLPNWSLSLSFFLSCLFSIRSLSVKGGLCEFLCCVGIFLFDYGF